jgi:hypothetical protein
VESREAMRRTFWQQGWGRVAFVVNPAAIEALLRILQPVLVLPRLAPRATLEPAVEAGLSPGRPILGVSGLQRPRRRSTEPLPSAAVTSTAACAAQKVAADRRAAGRTSVIAGVRIPDSKAVAGEKADRVDPRHD